jgi:hypothetical protein
MNPREAINRASPSSDTFAPRYLRMRRQVLCDEPA